MRTYRKHHQSFIIHFATALQSLLKNNNNNEPPTPTQQTDLLSLDRTLTHDTFALFPHLFDRSFNTNASLLHTTSLPAPPRRHNPVHQPAPGALFTSLISNFEENWIDLADAVDILDARHSRYGRWRKLEEEHAQLVGKLNT